MKDIKLSVDQKVFEQIAAEIHSETSPVGIDAKKTHILILEKLIAIEERLKALENKLASREG